MYCTALLCIGPQSPQCARGYSAKHSPLPYHANDQPTTTSPPTVGRGGGQGAPAVFWICSLRMRMLCLCSGGSMAICSGVSWSTCMIRAACRRERRKPQRNRISHSRSRDVTQAMCKLRLCVKFAHLKWAHLFVM